MLKNTFCHIPGIGPRLERRLWGEGFYSWDALLTGRRPNLPGRLSGDVGDHIHRSVAALDKGDARYFEKLLPSDQHWRLFSEFRHSTAYIDIETTGLGSDFAYITTIALYDGDTVHHYVQGDNLSSFENDIKRYKLIVTYNGKCFDVPFIERYLRLPMKIAHIDLMYILRRLGYTGGLKGCEKRLGISRGDLDGVDGYFAVLLWNDFLRNGNERALETLLAYNTEDVINLETLMVTAYNMRLRHTPFASTLAFELPTSPRPKFKPDRDTILRLRRENGFI